jgi:hypothetical protein
MVPLAGAVQVFSTHVEVPPFGTGSGVPKLQPVFVQSGPGVLTGGVAEVGPMVQFEPVHASEKRLIEPSGVGPSATKEPPPPMLSPPQVRFLNGPPASRMSPHTPPAGRNENSSVVSASGHWERSLVQFGLQSIWPPGVGQTKLPKSPPSHSSPTPITPSPQPGGIVVVVDVGGAVDDVLVLVVDILVVVVVVLVVVVVVGHRAASLAPRDGMSASISDACRQPVDLRPTRVSCHHRYRLDSFPQVGLLDAKSERPKVVGADRGLPQFHFSR